MLARYLSGEGFRVSLAENGDVMKDVLAKEAIDLILLDLILPREDGLVLARDIRRDYPHIGIVMLTGRSDMVDRVVGLEVGADDYVAKPFHLREVLARIRSVLRRVQQARAVRDHEKAERPIIRFEGWQFDLQRRQLTTPTGQNVALTTGEFELLQILISHSGRVLHRDRLMNLTRGRAHDALDRTIDAQVARLRKKIEIDPRHPIFIKSVRNVGYVFTGDIEP